MTTQQCPVPCPVTGNVDTKTLDGVKVGRGVLFSGVLGRNMHPIEIQGWKGDALEQEKGGEVSKTECRVVPRPRLYCILPTCHLLPTTLLINPIVIAGQYSVVAYKTYMILLAQRTHLAMMQEALRFIHEAQDSQAAWVNERRPSFLLWQQAHAGLRVVPATSVPASGVGMYEV